MQTNQRHFQTIRKAIELIHSSTLSDVDLSSLADKLHISESHFQRLFTDWAGISPKRYTQFLQNEAALRALSKSSSVLDVSLQVGLSSPGRLHDLMVTTQAMTPGEVRQKGQNIDIQYGFVETRFGRALIATTTRGICHLSFITDGDEQSLNKLLNEWSHASFSENSSEINKLAETIFSPLGKPGSVSVLLKGSNFQIKVWEALLKTSAGSVTSYKQLANKAGNEKASRAVGTAMANNPVGYLIPCHRVIKANLNIGQYQWETGRKQMIQAWETCQVLQD